VKRSLRGPHVQLFAWAMMPVAFVIICRYPVALNPLCRLAGDHPLDAATGPICEAGFLLPNQSITHGSMPTQISTPGFASNPKCPILRRARLNDQSIR
jgi:hypothetical protein